MLKRTEINGLQVFELIRRRLSRKHLSSNSPFFIFENIDIAQLYVQSFDHLLVLLERFHLIARQLRVRHDSRVTLDVSDEYDVQDLLHSILRIYFDDIRAEEWCPSYAGKSSRMDFLLHEYDIVIEVKKTRIGLAGKEVGTQLIEDIARYKRHPNCKTLICFVYDPEGRIGNPKGIENDLSVQSSDINVRVIIRP